MQNIVSNNLNPIWDQLNFFQHTSHINRYINLQPQPSYANKIKNSLQTCVIIKFKNVKLPLNQTKNEVLNSIQPLTSKIKFINVKSVSNSDIVIDCADKAKWDKLVNLAETKLPTSYNIKKPSTILLAVWVVEIEDGIDKKMTLIISQNFSLFDFDSICTIQKFWKTYKNKKIWQAELNVDLESYHRLFDSGHMLVGLNSCSIFDAVSALRSYNSLNHGLNLIKQKTANFLKKKHISTSNVIRRLDARLRDNCLWRD